MGSYFITASGTGVGKTVVTARLVRELAAAKKSVHAVKPLITGFTWHGLKHNDTGRLLRALELEPTPENVNAVSPWRFEEPMSPDMAARREDRAIDFDELLAYSRGAMAADVETRLIEGVGGVMVPLTETQTVADWIDALDIPSILVVGSYLGTLSHSLTAVEAMRARGLDIAAMVISESKDSPVPLAETVDTLQRFLPDLEILALPRAKYEPGQPDILADLVS